MPKFTPGPWKVKSRYWSHDAKFEISVAGYDYWIALIGALGTNSKPYEKEIEGNARLIAAAPEMYAMLREFESILPTIELRALLNKIDKEG